MRDPQIKKNRFPQSVFRLYDVRGLSNEELSEELYFSIGQAFPSFIENKSHPVCVGHDTRLDSPRFSKALTEGLLSVGQDVLSLGAATTPLVYWTEYYKSCSAGLMVTGSHTDPDRNGLKLSLNKTPFYGDKIQRLYETIEESNLNTEPSQYPGKNLFEDYKEEYVRSIFPKPFQNKKIVWDFGNGAASYLYTHLKNLMPPGHIFLNTAPKPFPDRPFDPTKTNALKKMSTMILDKKADAGIAFDGDGDRLIVVDNTGRVCLGDELLLLFSLGQNSTAPCIADLKSSPLLLQSVSEKRPLLFSRTGHVYLKTAMKEKKATLGGEMSGHFFFRDDHPGFDDGLYAACRFLETLIKMKAPLSSWRSKRPQNFSTPEVRLSLPAERQKEILTACIKQIGKTAAIISQEDGLHVQEKEGWWIMRSSQTEPCLVLRWEGLKMDYYNEKKNFFKKNIPESVAKLENTPCLC